MSASMQRPATRRSSGELRALAPALAAPREQIEATFVGVGARLAEGAQLLSRLTKVFEALPTQLESPQLQEASARLAAIGAQAQAISTLFATEKSELERLVAVVAAADHPIAALRRTVKMMGIVAINARVVAAAVAGATDDFEVFTTDIAKLSESATRTIQDFTTVYHRLTAEVGEAARQRSLFEAAHADTLTGLARSMDAALAEVARQRAGSLASSAETGRVSRQIVGRIANAVMALQVGDATRQRLEHVEAGLESLCTFEAGADEDLARSALGGLQAAQLAAAVAAFEDDVGEAGNALRDLAADARVIMAHSHDLYGRAGGQSPLAALSLAVRRGAAVLRDCEAERSKLEAVAAAVQATVGVLLGHVEAVQEIEANMRLVSLNAAVKCAQLGPRGAALNVIARQLRELTGETVEAAEAAMAGLHEAASLARSFGAAANGDAAAQLGLLEQEATAALQLLETVDRALAEALASLHRDGPKVIDLLGQAATRFVSQSAISETMADLHQRLVELCPERSDALPPAVVDALVAHRARYTMDAERQIHDRLFGMLTPATPVQPEPAGQEAALDNIFF